jgi:hypothetical protein
VELLKPNYVDTSTSIVVQSNTVTAEYIMNPDTSFQYVSSGYNNDLTTTTLRINFGSTLTVSRIALSGINLKDFLIYYNGVTANTFSLTTTGATTTSDFSSNSETSLYLRCTPVACTSVSIDMKKTTTANQEKAIGYLVLSQERIDLSTTRLPTAKNYTPMLETRQVVHKLSDGNTRIQIIDDKWKVDIKLDYVSRSVRDALLAIYKLHESHIFVPFGTTTSWDKVIFPCVWDSPFDFYKFSDNAPDVGFDGKIKLLETTP